MHAWLLFCRSYWQYFISFSLQRFVSSLLVCKIVGSLITPSQRLPAGTQITLPILDACILLPVEDSKAHGAHVTTIAFSFFKLTFGNRPRSRISPLKADRMQISGSHNTVLLTVRTGWTGLFTSCETESRYENLEIITDNSSN